MNKIPEKYFTSKTTKIKASISIILGNFFEFYSFILFPVYAKYLSSAFYPEKGANAEIIIYLISFGGYISRPIGAIIIGGLSDLIGRKKLLSLTVLLSGMCSLLIGVMPAPKEPHIICLFIIMILRFFQGFLSSGEEGNAAVFLSEIYNLKSNGMCGSIVLSSVFIGILIGMLSLPVLENAFSQELMCRSLDKI